MPLFSWIGKEKVVNHDKEVSFRLLRKNKSLSLGERSENLIVEGDNLEALKALLPFYYGKVKCIYIDPPYNTGNEKWVYNDRVNSAHIKEWLGKVVGPEGEDLTRHDKWLYMMYPRLKLLHQLLREDGGNRKFILVELEKKIAREITQERVRRVAKKLFGSSSAKATADKGSFEYAELGEPLFSADGTINEKVSFEEMASYVYFTETLSNIDNRKIKGAFIGEHNGTEYYLLFKQKGGNILNRAALKGIKKNEERKVVYADKSLLSKEILEQYNIAFKQIPYQVRVY